MMQGVAPLVISQMRKASPEGLFLDLSKQSTGLTVKRYFDWPTKIREESTLHRIDTIVMFLGPNDPWDIYEGNKRYPFPSESWANKYRERVNEVLSFAQSRKMHVIWIGLPNMKEERFKTGAVIENQIFNEETKKRGFVYLSTEDFLGKLDEPFNKYVDDSEKGKLLIRAEDGIHFAPTGLRMISARVVSLLNYRNKS